MTKQVQTQPTIEDFLAPWRQKEDFTDEQQDVLNNFLRENAERGNKALLDHLGEDRRNELAQAITSATSQQEGPFLTPNAVFNIMVVVVGFTLNELGGSNGK